MDRRAAISVLILLLTAALPLRADTFLLVLEEWRDGERVPLSMASREGMMAALFDAGQVAFDMDAGQTRVDWDRLGFRSVLAIARQGGARYVMAARIRSTVTTSPGEGRERTVSIASRALYYLLRAGTSAVVGAGSFDLQGQDRESEDPYRAFLFRVGQELSSRLIQLWEADRS